MRRLGFAFSIAMTVWAGSAFGQQLGQEIIDEQRLLNVTKGGADFSAVKWEAVKRDVPADEIKVELQRAGWDTGTILKNLEGGTTFDLYQKALGPGQVGFMTLPKSGVGAEPATFIPVNPSAEILTTGGAAPISVSFTTDQIKAELVRGIETGINTFCGLQTKPSTVTMTVDAFGFVEVQATWNTEDVCPPGTP